MMKLRLFALLCAATFVGLIFYAPSAAQVPGGGGGGSGEETCPAIVSDALVALENDCTGIGRNAACYGNNNRTNMLRIPMGGGRVECRAADISTNLYLGAAMILAAGLEGIREGLDPGEPHTENMYEYSLDELMAMGIDTLP